MNPSRLAVLIAVTSCAALAVRAQPSNSCADLTRIKLEGVEITKSQLVLENATIAPPFPGAPSVGALPAHCRVDGVIHRRKGADSEEFGVGFALALPERAAWNGDFMMQGGGGGNGVVAYPMGASYSGEKPALAQGFTVASTDTGHKAKNGAFDFSFMRDQQAYLDFAYQANAEVAGIAKQIIVHYFGKPAAYSYFIGCSTGGREGMILSQRFPTVFNGIVSGDPAMRTGLSNLAIGKWIPVAYNQAAPKDESSKPRLEKLLSDRDRNLFMHTLIKTCDARDGVADGMIFDPLGCQFDPAVMTCKAGQNEGCIAPEKIEAIKKAFDASDPLVEPASTNLSTFSGSGGKLIFFHGDSDPWFSPLDTLGYYQSLGAANGGPDQVAAWSRLYLVPGMAHCGGGPALDRSDMLGAVVNWVEKGTAPDAVIASGQAFPGEPVHSAPIQNTPNTQKAETAGMRGTFNASDGLAINFRFDSANNLL